MRSEMNGNHLKVELNVIGLQAGDLLLVFVVDVGQHGVFTLANSCEFTDTE